MPEGFLHVPWNILLPSISATVSSQLCLLPGVEGHGRGLRAAPGPSSRPLCCAARYQLDRPDSLFRSPHPWSGKVQCSAVEVMLAPEADSTAAQSGAVRCRAGRLLLNSSGVYRVPGTWLTGSWVLQKGRGSGSQASLPDCPAPGPGPAASAAALRAGGEHGADLAPHQQAGRLASAALPGLAHRHRLHRLPPVEGQPLSRAPAAAHRGEEQLRHQGTGKGGGRPGKGGRHCRQAVRLRGEKEGARD